MRNDGIDVGGNSISLADYRLAQSGAGMIHPEIRALHSYWERLRAGRPCPERAEIDPRAIAADARHLFLLEDLGEGNVRFRLAGTALLDAFGYDLRGMSARSIMAGPARESLVAFAAETLAESGVGYARLLAPDGVTVWEMILLPLRGNLGKIDRLLGCLHPVSGRIPQAGREPLRFTIDAMTIHAAGEKPQAAGLAEAAAPFGGAPSARLTGIEGGRRGTGTAGNRADLRVVRDDD